VVHEFTAHSDDLHSQLAGGGEMFLTPGRDLAGDSLVMGAALSAPSRQAHSPISAMTAPCKATTAPTDLCPSLRVGWMF
jgi:hypothetical protein